MFMLYICSKIKERMLEGDYTVFYLEMSFSYTHK